MAARAHRASVDDFKLRSLLILLMFRYSPTLAKNLWIECRLPSLLHKKFRIPERSQSVANYTNSNAKNKTLGRCHTDHLSSQDSQPPPQLSEQVVNAPLDRSSGSGDRASFVTLCDVNAG
jgi:hypothetical protein